VSRPTITDLSRRLAACPPGELDALLGELEKDDRAGVHALARAWRARLERLASEEARLETLMRHQSALHASGVRIVAGVDEVGRGALAGPLTVAAVVLDLDCRIHGLNDSKRLAPAARERISVEVRQRARAFAIVHVPAAEIDAIGIGRAVRVGMCRALAALTPSPDHALVDGNDARLDVPATAVVGGDRHCACIAAASVIAKVERDALMRGLAVEFPGFGFELNKGYGTSEHIAAVVDLGPSPMHRRSFAPCSQGPLF
jgi:ribonuclease HII